MESNNKILKVGIILIIATLVLGIATATYLKLDNPVFLKSYMELDLPILDNGRFGQTNFEIRYITNANDERLIDHIEFVEAPEDVNRNGNNLGIDMFGNFGGSIPGETKGRYSIRSIYVTLDFNEVENTLEEIHLTKAKVHFSNGEIIETDIGDIVLYGNNNPGERYQLQYHKRPYAESSRTQGTVQEETTLIKVELPVLEEVKEFIEFKINNVDYDKIVEKTYSVGDSLVVDSMFSTPDDPILKFNTYAIHPKVTFKDEDGNLTYQFYNMEYRKHGFEFMEIIEFLRARGEI